MLFRHAQGRLSALISLLTQPRRNLEIGHCTDSLALFFGEGLTHHGLLYTIGRNVEKLTRIFFDLSKYASFVNLPTDQAFCVISCLGKPLHLWTSKKNRREKHGLRQLHFRSWLV